MNIKKSFTDSGLSLARLARLSGLSKSTVQRCIRHNRLPQNAESRCLFREALGVKG
jgi:lambda repressor-like predicted transcriptional regulator